jgi:flagellar biosynthesis/type III secretory pathway protein FliH
MNQKKLEKLQKLYALASNNPNENEAIVAAHKFVNAIKKDGLHMTLSEQPQPTEQQIEQALQANYQKGFTEGRQHSYNQGYQDGYYKGLNENQQPELEQETERYMPTPTNSFIYYANGTTSATIRVNR